MLRKFITATGFIAVATALADLLLVALHRERRDGDDRDCPQATTLLEPPGDLDPGDRGDLNTLSIRSGWVLPVKV